MIARTIKRAFRTFGYSIGRYRPPVWGEDAFLDQERGLADAPVRIVFDIGANRGDVVQRYRAMFPEAVIYAFEPFPEVHEQLAVRFAGDARVRPQRLAIADANGTASLHVNAAHETKSLLPMERAAARWNMAVPAGEPRRTEVPVVTLDAFCGQQGIDTIDLLKMDIQGAEARALRGATTLLARKAIRLVYLEVNFAPLYEGQASFCEVSDILGAAGYRLGGLYNLVQGEPGLGWADAIFRVCP